MVEVHLCKEIQTMKNEMKRTHGENLNKERTTDVKLLRI